MAVREANRKGTDEETAGSTSGAGFTEEERAAMKERAREAKAERAGGRSRKADGEAEVLAKLAEMPEADRVIGERIYAIVKRSAPNLSPKTWYGMPAWAKDGRVVCFYQGAEKFKSRYPTLGFSDLAHLDDGAMWPTSFALTKLGEPEEARICELVKSAVG